DEPSVRRWSARASLAGSMGLVALSLLVAFLASGQGVAHGSARFRSAAGSSAAGTPQQAVSYRIVGCRSRGAAPYRGGPPRRVVAIGFDDGPASDTAAFVSMLEHSHARATFFEIGRQVSASYRATMLRALRDGDVLGDHTYNHPDLTRGGVDVQAELLHTIGAIRAQTGYTPCLFRPPYGAYDAAVVRAARALGLATVMWNVDPADWAQPGTTAIEQRVLAQVRPGSIVISHDGGGSRGQTLAAYPHIIAALRRRGYGIVTINELLGFRPVYAPCIRLCDSLGIPRAQLPRDAILQRVR
ncbi:MAG: polysaccharide deacetylase family protein, partial [Solirubrobacterales bacterium]